MTTCGKCGTKYGGQRTEHCMSCHETFTGNEAGDLHRIGEHDNPDNPRRCRTVQEMWDKGMTQDVRGCWSRGRKMSPEAIALRQQGDR